MTPRFLRLSLSVARRELTIYLRSPIALVIAGAFLILEGISFASLVSALADPARPAPLGAVLESHFGGTLLHWTLELTVLAALAARIAEERRSGTWEALVTAPVPEGAAVLGAWLAAVTLWATLWLICLSHVVILVALAPPNASIDAGPIITAYAGEVLVGAAGLALAFAAGAWSSQTMVATIAGFAALAGWLLLGELPDLAPALVWDPAILERLGPRRVLATLARGELRWDAIVTMVALIAFGLRLATALGGAGRRRRGTVAASAVEAILLGAALALAAVLIGRALDPWDVTAARRNSLEPATRVVLARMREPVTATVLAPSIDANRPLFDETARVLARMVAAQPALRVVPFDPAADRAAVPALAAVAAVEETQLVRGGAVILTRGQRVRAIALRDLEGAAGSTAPPGAARTFEHVRIEAGLGQALAELLDETPIRVCASSGHGELPLEGGESWSPIVARLAVDGIGVGPAEVRGGVPATCRVLVIAGPTIAFTMDETAAIATYLDRGGRVLLALPAAVAGEPARATGLELVLAAWGIEAPTAWAVDPALSIDLPLAVRVVDGYGDHPITLGFAGRRATVWQRARPLIAPKATALVATTDGGWGETTLTPPPHRDPADVSGPVTLALARERGIGRMVVLGSAAAMTEAEAARGWGVDVLTARAISWLAGRTAPPVAPEKDGDRVRLVMSSSARHLVAALAIAGVPLAALALLVLAGRRRRR